MSPQRLSFINGLRGVALLGVVLHHSFFHRFRYGLETGRLGPLEVLGSSGWLGVNLFFFLSGFVLYYPYLLGRRRMESLADVRWFLRHRAERLLPLYLFIGVLGLVLISGLP